MERQADILAAENGMLYNGDSGSGQPFLQGRDKPLIDGCWLETGPILRDCNGRTIGEPDNLEVISTAT